jgi:hypothetical protein
MPALASQPAPKHAALVWLVRGTSFVANVFGVIVLLFIWVVPVMLFFKAVTDASNSEGYRITMFFFGLVLALFYGFIVKRIYDSFRKCRWELNAKTVANFSSLFALFLAIDWYHILPAHLPKLIADYCRSHPPLVPFAEEGPGFTYRAVLSFIAFFVFYKLIKAELMRILDSDIPNSPQNLPNPPPPDADTPEYPQKSPLVQL